MKSFSILLIKILALYLVLTTIYSFIPIVFYGNIKSILTRELMIVLSATIILPIIGGIALWKYAQCIADKIYKNDTVLDKNTDTEIVSAGLFLVGITLFIKHIGILINYYLSMDQINYGSIFVIFISFLLIFRTDLLKKLYLKFNK